MEHLFHCLHKPLLPFIIEAPIAAIHVTLYSPLVESPALRYVVLSPIIVEHDEGKTKSIARRSRETEIMKYLILLKTLCLLNVLTKLENESHSIVRNK